MVFKLARSQKRKNCKQCGKAKVLSNKGLCWDCAKKNINEAVYQMQHKEGPRFEKWKKSLQLAASRGE